MGECDKNYVNFFINSQSFIIYLADAELIYTFYYYLYLKLNVWTTGHINKFIIMKSFY